MFIEGPVPNSAFPNLVPPISLIVFRPAEVIPPPHKILQIETDTDKESS